MSNIFSTSFGINFAKLTRVWLALISLTGKINSLHFFEPPCIFAYKLLSPCHSLPTTFCDSVTLKERVRNRTVTYQRQCRIESVWVKRFVNMTALLLTLQPITLNEINNIFTYTMFQKKHSLILLAIS